MPTLTANYSFNLPIVGADDDVWGGLLNDNWTALDTLLDSGAVGATASAWTDPITLTIGATGKSLDGTAAVSFNASEIGITKADVGLGNVDNVSAANLRDRSTHTGTQAPSTIALADGPRLVGRGGSGAGAAGEVAVTGGLELDGSGLGIAAGGVVAAKIADLAVTTAKIVPAMRMTTANVLGATAGAAFGAVGSYALAARNDSTNMSPGDTIAGGSLFPVGIMGSNTTFPSAFLPAGGTALAGTWRAMGQVAGDRARRGTLFLRIS